jgi:hypothetical protein
MKKLITALALCGLATTVAQAQMINVKKAKKFQGEFVNGYPPCDAPDNTTGGIHRVLPRSRQGHGKVQAAGSREGRTVGHKCPCDAQGAVGCVPPVRRVPTVCRSGHGPDHGAFLDYDRRGGGGRRTGDQRGKPLSPEWGMHRRAAGRPGEVQDQDDLGKFCRSGRRGRQFRAASHRHRPRARLLWKPVGGQLEPGVRTPPRPVTD